MNKKIILLLILILCISIVFTGCQSNKLPDGIESKIFFKDLNKAYELLADSMADNTYYEEDINKIFDKMNKIEYKNKLNDYELLILESLNGSLDGIKKDLTTGERIIQSSTTKDIDWIFEIMSEYWTEQNEK